MNDYKSLPLEGKVPEGQMRCDMPALVFLNQGYKLELQVQSKLQQIADLRALATQVRSYSDHEPVSHTRDVTTMQSTVAKIVEEEETMNSRIDALVDAKREIREVIDCVEDVTLRLILEKRHLLFQPWEEIAIDLGITSRWAKDRHREALKAVERVLEEKSLLLEEKVAEGRMRCMSVAANSDIRERSIAL